ncbi:YfgM family protein [Allorhodopirellula solitaria]|nr:tetratricopeptide repeat protein [Allorhodopirellula solitaria]
MNSERRHELQENELASAIDRINTKIEPYSKPIAAVLAIAFIGLLAWGFYSSMQAEQRSDATYQLMEGSVRGDSEMLATVAATYPETPMAAWARLYQGSQKMAAGINSLFSSRDEAEELLAEASSAYEEALSLSDDNNILIQSRAHYGLARIAESLGDTDEAIAQYEATMEAGESEAMTTEAQQRIALLSKPAAESFLTWFDEQDFTPADPSLPPALPSDQMLPDLPDLDFPEIETSTGPEPAAATEEAMDQPAAQDGAGESEPAGNEEAASDAEPAADEPTAEETATEENAAEEPATEEPTADEPAVEEASTEPEAAMEEEAPADAEPEADAEPAADSDPEPAAEPADAPAEEPSDAPAETDSESSGDEGDDAVGLEAPSNS